MASLLYSTSGSYGILILRSVSCVSLPGVEVRVRVVASAAAEEVSVRAAGQRVIATATGHAIVAGTAVECVVVVAA